MKNGKMSDVVAAGWILLAAVVATGVTGCGDGAPKAGAVKTITLPGGARMEMVWCPPGTFTMGCPEKEEFPEEKYPEGKGDMLQTENQHEVTLTKGFWLAKHEVTQRQWKSVMGDNPSLFDDDDDKPVERVDLESCREFCRRAGLVLPTEAQWEYACRAGSKEAYGGKGRLDAMGWYAANSGSETHPVGKKVPNAWGLHDMHGNVEEWCADGYDVYPDHAVTNPAGRPSMMGVVVRGGNWESDAMDCRSASRASGLVLPLFKHERLGFRPAFETQETAMEKKGAPGKAAGTGETGGGVAAGIAETEGTGRKMELTGMFGVRFGQVMPESRECMTNNVGERAYDYTPATPLEGFGEYVLFATPVTRRVSQIRAVRMVNDLEAAMLRTIRGEEAARSMFDDEEYNRLYADQDAETDVETAFQNTVRSLERRFKQAGKPLGDQDKRHFLFANSNVVTVTKMDDRIYIDAWNAELKTLTQREVGEQAVSQFAEDLRTLALRPAKQEGETLSRIDSVFGVVFGERCRWGWDPTENDTGAWAYTFEPSGTFMDCAAYRVFATAQSRRVFMVRAVFVGDSDSEAQGKFDQMQRLLEYATGGTFEDEEASGNDKMCRMLVGDRFVIDITKNWERDIVMLDFWDKKLLLNSP